MTAPSFHSMSDGAPMSEPPRPSETPEQLRDRLYLALKHEKGCSCGRCSGGLNAVDSLLTSLAAAEAELETLRAELRDTAKLAEQRRIKLRSCRERHTALIESIAAALSSDGRTTLTEPGHRSPDGSDSGTPDVRQRGTAVPAALPSPGSVSVASCAHPTSCDEIGNICSYEDCPFGIGSVLPLSVRPTGNEEG